MMFPENLTHTQPHELHALLNREGVWVIDVREPDEYRYEHIEGVRLFPLDHIEEARAQIPPTAEIHILCHTGVRSAQAAAQLREWGYEKVSVVDGGLTAWKAEGGPVVRGKGPIPIMRQVQIVAGSLVLVGSLVSGLKFIALIVGAGLLFAGVSGWCGMAKLLAFLPWNKNSSPSSSRPA